MPATLNIVDETLGGESLHEWAMEVLTDTLTVRQLIRERVYQEVQDYNRRQPSKFRGLVQPGELEVTLNGDKSTAPRQINWKAQYEKAIEAFENNLILILVNEVQAESLDQEIELRPGATVSFVKLKMLVGG
jgi:hypothetical protein